MADTFADRLGFATEAEFLASLTRGPGTLPRQAAQDGPGPIPVQYRSNTGPIPVQYRPEAETHPWRPVARACPWRVVLDEALRLRYQSCQCREPADCLQGKATVRPWVGIDTECRQCVEAGGGRRPDFA